MAVDTRSMIDVDPEPLNYNSLHLYAFEDLRAEKRRLEAMLRRTPGDADAHSKLARIDQELQNYIGGNGWAK